MQRALKTRGGSSWLLFFVALVACFFMVGFAQAVARSYYPALPPWLPLVISLAIFLPILTGVLLPWLRRQTIRRFDELLPPTLTRLAADEAGLTISDELSHGHWDWRHVRGAVATPDGIAVLMGYSGIHVPASAFRDAGEQAAVIELINRRSDRSAM